MSFVYFVALREKETFRPTIFTFPPTSCKARNNVSNVQTIFEIMPSNDPLGKIIPADSSIGRRTSYLAIQNPYTPSEENEAIII